MKLFLSILALSLGFTSCGDSEAAPVIRISAIPDDLRTRVATMHDKLCAYLKQATGVEIRFLESTDYTAAVNGLLGNTLDLVWLGGVTSVDAADSAGADAVFVATRDIDLQFKSYFIANHRAIADGKVKKVDQIGDLKPMLPNLTMTFGSKKSTSGHIMPRHFLVKAGIDPDRDLKSPAAYRLSGGHGATLQAVASGEVDLGALNYKTYDKATEEQKSQAPIIYTTPHYVDYCWIGHRRIGDDVFRMIKDARRALDASNPDHKLILDAWGAGKFVAADPEQWDGIRQVMESLPRDFLK